MKLFLVLAKCTRIVEVLIVIHETSRNLIVFYHFSRPMASMAWILIIFLNLFGDFLKLTRSKTNSNLRNDRETTFLLGFRLFSGALAVSIGEGATIKWIVGKSPIWDIFSILFETINWTKSKMCSSPILFLMGFRPGFMKCYRFWTGLFFSCPCVDKVVIQWTYPMSCSGF